MHKTEMEQLKKLYQKGLFKPSFYASKIGNSHAFDSYEEFVKIPFTYKSELRNSSVWDRTNTVMDDVYGVFSSSGTTGDKTFYIYNKNDKKVHEEFVRTFFSELGVMKEDLGGVMAPVDTGVMAHTMMWQFTTMGAGYVNCPIPSPENIIDVISKVPVTIVATRPNIAANVAYNSEFAEIAHDSKVNKLLMGGGFLSKERRKLLEKVWNADCYNLFGMSEMFGPMASECRKKDGLHYLNNYLLIEIIDPDTKEPVKKGEVGVAVYTTLWEKGFPLLRYWTDDMMKITYEKCECGSTLPRLYYQGRLADHIRNGDIYVYPENVENILFSYGFIGDYKVSKEIDKVNIKIESVEKIIPQQMCNQLEELFGLNVCVEIVGHGSLEYRGYGNRFE